MPCPALKAPNSSSRRPCARRRMSRPGDALAAGEIDTVGTDHCSFDFYGPKQLGREDLPRSPTASPVWSTAPVLLYTAGVAAGRMSAHQLMQGFCRSALPSSSGCTRGKGLWRWAATAIL